MALWVDRTADVEGPGLHALVIGVSDYRFLPEDGQFPDPKHFTLGLTKVSIPATGAFRVATWLRDHYWHPEVKIKTIDLLLSPHPKEITPETNPPKGEVDEMRAQLAAEAAALARPDTLNVEQALKSWRKRCEGQPGDVALLYVSGHGIQWGSKDDAIVLLEDFGESEDLFLKRAIDIGRTMKGMAGDEMPQTQLYFVDACQIQPDEHANFEDAGDPVRLSSKFGITDLRSAPIYFGAVSQSAAKGKNGTGTYFAQALVQCLTLDALEAPDESSVLEAERFWHTTVSGLLPKLQDAVTDLAKIDGEKQDIVLGGRTRKAVFSALNGPPSVTVVLDVGPDNAAKASKAELRTAARDATVRGPADCWERPLVIKDVPAGVYFLEVSATGGFKPVSPIFVDAKPARWERRVIVS